MVNFASWEIEDVDNHFHLFQTFVSNMSKNDRNWEFWSDFVFSSCFSYIAFFLSIRSGNWHLRLGSLKLLAPIFASFDRTTYRKLIPQHIADCLLLPENLKMVGFQLAYWDMTGIPWQLMKATKCLQTMIARKQSLVPIKIL